MTGLQCFTQGTSQGAQSRNGTPYTEGPSPPIFHVPTTFSLCPQYIIITGCKNADTVFSEGQSQLLPACSPAQIHWVCLQLSPHSPYPHHSTEWHTGTVGSSTSAPRDIGFMQPVALDPYLQREVAKGLTLHVCVQIMGKDSV